MAPPLPPNADDTTRLLEQAAGGDRAAWGALLTRHTDRLLRMLALRLDTRLQGRIDPADVLQETCVDALRRLPDYLREPTMPFFLWLRFLAGQKLLELHRHHLGAQRRAAGREVALGAQSRPEASSAALAEQLVGRLTSPSEAAMRRERQARLEAALERMDAADREVLTLRHFEQLTNAETAAELGLTEAAASKRYLRAMKRLKEALAAHFGDFAEG
jgi:RNA polymerase sigma-70 factor (ECF subfamily)